MAHLRYVEVDNTKERKIRDMKKELARLYSMGGKEERIKKIEAELNKIELGRTTQ